MARLTVTISKMIAKIVKKTVRTIRIEKHIHRQVLYIAKIGLDYFFQTLTLSLLAFCSFALNLKTLLQAFISEK